MTRARSSRVWSCHDLLLDVFIQSLTCSMNCLPVSSSKHLDLSPSSTSISCKERPKSSTDSCSANGSVLTSSLKDLVTSFCKEETRCFGIRLYLSLPWVGNLFSRAPSATGASFLQNRRRQEFLERCTVLCAESCLLRRQVLQEKPELGVCISVRLDCKILLLRERNAE